MSENIEYKLGDEVETEFIPFWNGKVGEVVDGFISRIFPAPIGMQNSKADRMLIEINTLVAGILTVKTGIQKDDIEERAVATGEMVVLPTHGDLERKLFNNKVKLKQGDRWRIELKEISEVEVFDNETKQKVMRDVRKYSVRPYVRIDHEKEMEQEKKKTFDKKFKP